MGLLSNFVIMQVSGTSMAPTLKPGDVVVASKRREPQVGQVVIAAHPETGAWIIKRLTKIEADGFWLEGDAHDPGTAATSADSWVFGALAREQIHAVVIWPRRKRD
jgi:nickel-type superoxide dismutase maturation protease